MRRRFILAVWVFLSILFSTTAMATDYYITTPLTISPYDSLVVGPSDHYYFSGTGKIIVPTSAKLIFAANPSNEAVFSLSSGMPSNWPIIEISSGGFVTGKHVQFIGLPLAISNNNGKVVLDSVSFSNCTIAFDAPAFSDTISFTHSTFSGGQIGLRASAVSNSSHYLRVSYCQFYTNNLFGLDLYNIRYASIDHCYLNGGSVSGSTGIYLQECGSSLYIGFSTSLDWGGNIEWIDSSPRLSNDSILCGLNYGIFGSGDCAGEPFARIDSCIIGWNAGLGGFAGYNCEPVFVCNEFIQNTPYQVYAMGNATLVFYDAQNIGDGGNSFYGYPGEPIVYIVDSAPIFTLGANDFYLDDPQYPTGIYMEDASYSPVTHNLKYNYFANGASINYFVPPSTKTWLNLNRPSPGNSCGSTLEIGYGTLGYEILQGDILRYQPSTLSGTNGYTPEYWYRMALLNSGDTTFAAIAALQRLSRINPVLATSARLQRDMRFCASYGFDVARNFRAADSIRSVILRYAQSYDSARVAYDNAVSRTLRSRVHSNGNSLTRNEEIQLRRDLFKQVLASSPRPKPQMNATANMPVSFQLLPVYPNPFNATAQIRFEVPSNSHVSVGIYDVDGRLVTTLTDADYTTGSYRLEWNGKNSSGVKVAAGIYFVTMRTPNAVMTKKAILLK